MFNHRNPNHRAQRARWAALRAEADHQTAAHFAGEIVDVRRPDGAGVDTVRIITMWTEPASGTPMLTVMAHPHGLLSRTVRADAVVTGDGAPGVVL
ncbi:hypothetical protein [Glycomyces paridis]|uniref:Uncharacterized protein n=1 Tax=Glycomyces paridis TaxID=2126555 RepID=A0A4S8PC67_9ACTN|nr:hypothetical protein [Glycomyces paridis]THV27913.1 hypothetical protein E9998_13050 [Glycomyces paridis]